jgi:2-C-methyl-D-erythritol 4-phosphate cytidylyltransferase/2-C-methyl-D-erythritol 2,4-cyclodiphosphate synthase
MADAIVVAAGRSARMGGTDKLFTVVGDRPLLGWTLAAMAASAVVDRIVVVTGADRRDEVAAAPWLPSSVEAVVIGGERRQDSVAAGFAALTEAPGDHDRVVLVHDGARPLVTDTVIVAVADATAAYGAAIPVVAIAETVKRVEGDVVAETIDRTTLRAGQTPQGVRRGLLRTAFAAYPPGGPQTWTDEAALLEACRIPVHVVPGDPSNIKVTLPADLDRATTALVGPSAMRTGIGTDAHPFGAGEPLALGGIAIAGAPRLHGHSDGDVAIHAVCDALLGAAGQGDLGRIFPAGPETPAGIASADLLVEVVRRIGDAGWRVGNVDLTITAARPRLGAHLDAMRDAIAGLLGVPTPAVNVKASSGNLIGDEGAGRAISAIAVATVGRQP